jgi:DNA-binding MarR family transcriptional regulator
MKIEMPDAGEASECVCLNLRMSTRALTQVYDEALKPTGLRITQYSMLRAIRRLGPVPLQRLSEALALDQTTLPRNLRPLQKNGYVRVVTGSDRRERLASLTPKGTAALEAAQPLWRKTQDRIRSRFSAKQLETLLTALTEMRIGLGQSR